MSDLLPPHVRPITFAGTELILDLLYVARSIYNVDLESFLILLCVSDATMRPFVLDPQTPPEILHAPRPPNSVRGSISRRMIADKTGLPRETVRRKIAELAATSHLTVDADDRVRIGQSLDQPESQRVIEAGHQVVVRYLERLRALGVDWQCVPNGAPLADQT